MKYSEAINIRRYIIYGLTDPRDGSIRYIGSTSRTVEERLAEHISEALEYWERHSKRLNLRFAEDHDKAYEEFLKGVSELYHITIPPFSGDGMHDEFHYWQGDVIPLVAQYTRWVNFIDEERINHANWLGKLGWIAFLHEVHHMQPGFLILAEVEGTRAEALLIEFRLICDHLQREQGPLYNKVARASDLVAELRKKRRKSVLDDKAWQQRKDKLISTLDRPLSEII